MNHGELREFRRFRPKELLDELLAREVALNAQEHHPRWHHVHRRAMR